MERLYLLDEGLPRLGQRNGTNRGNMSSQWPDRPSDPHSLAGQVLGLASYAHRSAVYLSDLSFEAVLCQAHAIGAEGVGLYNLRARPDVVQVDGLDQLGVGEIQLVEASVRDDSPTLVELRAHGAVGQHRAAFQHVSELGGHFSRVFLLARSAQGHKGEACDAGYWRNEEVWSW